jgi:hypothetical protein
LELVFITISKIFSQSIEMKKIINKMKIRQSIFLMIIMIVADYSQLFAQNKVQSKIEYTIVEVTSDKLIIHYDLNSQQPANKIWLEIYEGNSLISPKTISGDIGDNVNPGRNKTIVWENKNDGFDLTDRKMSITVKANVAYIPEQPIQAQVAPVPSKIENEKPKQQAVYPLFRPGIEAALLSSSDFSVGEIGLTFEYIAKPWWSILSGVEYQMAQYRSSTYSSDFGTDSWNYKSIIVPITAELKLNAGRWFRLFGGGGVENRFLIIEGDPALDINSGLNRYMIGLKLEAGIEIRNVRIGGALYHDINSYSVLDEKLSVVGLMVNWRFGGSKAYIKN